MHRVLHRDIKSANVFLTGTIDARLGDLGVARMLSKDTCFAKTLIGTPYYLSPEICDGKPYNDKSDVWAYGCVVYETCVLQRPFEAANILALQRRISTGKYEPIPEARSPELRALVASCLERDSSQRASISQILHGPAVSEWASKLQILVARPGETSTEPTKVRAWKNVRRLGSQISRLYDDAVKDLDEPTRDVWGNLYRLFRAKMCDDLTEEDESELEKHIFEELPTENTALIFKATEILKLEHECDHWNKILSS